MLSELTEGAELVEVSQVVGANMAARRKALGINQAELGQRLAPYTSVLWIKQAVSAAEKGDRAFTAADLVALSIVLGVPVGKLFDPGGLEPHVDEIELGGQRVPISTLTKLAIGAGSSSSAWLQGIAEARELVRAARRSMSQLDEQLRAMDE